ncbi:MAG: sodium-dependent transporter, partial [Simkania negevensis]|nr:sodium-dependent transporter [Simkania negevensis]
MTHAKREQWKSRLGFIWAAIGSAVGLGSIWRFPYVVGENGGAVFVLLYLVCLLLIGLPVLISEIIIGRKTQLNPSGAFAQLGRGALWRNIGKTTIFTGFLVSCFYAVIAGWTLGYLVESLFGRILSFQSSKETLHFFSQFTSSFWTAVGSLFGFLFLCFLVLYTGVQRGIERWNKVFIPLLLIMLVILAAKGLMMEGGAQGALFLFKPDFKELTPTAVLVALGQAFFSLSLGQGTMVTYGSYLTTKENLPSAWFPVAFFGIAISLLAGIAIFSIVFSFGLLPSSG